MSGPTKPIDKIDEAITPADADAPMTGDQADLLRALCEEAGEPYDGGLTQVQALRRIEALREMLNTKQNL